MFTLSFTSDKQDGEVRLYIIHVLPRGKAFRFTPFIMNAV